MNKKILVTTGATEPFRELIDFAFSKTFLYYLVSHNYTHVLIQHAGYEPACPWLKPTKFEALEQRKDEKRYLYGKLLIETFSYTSNVLSDVLECTYIISHAGTGLILDSLRAGKALLVVVNEELMDNHQEEIAAEFEKMGVLVGCKIKGVESYSTVLDKLDQLVSMKEEGELKSFGPQRLGVLDSILEDL